MRIEYAISIEDYKYMSKTCFFIHDKFKHQVLYKLSFRVKRWCIKYMILNRKSLDLSILYSFYNMRLPLSTSLIPFSPRMFSFFRHFQKD